MVRVRDDETAVHAVAAGMLVKRRDEAVEPLLLIAREYSDDLDHQRQVYAPRPPSQSPVPGPRFGLTTLRPRAFVRPETDCAYSYVTPSAESRLNDIESCSKA